MKVRDAVTGLVWMGAMMLAGLACATPGASDGRLALNDRHPDYELQVLVDGAPLPTFQHDGETYVLGQLGQRYTLRIRNNSPRRIEAVVSVDGRDAVDGKSADYRSKRGYLVPPWGQMEIDGWRLSQWQAAAFRFSTVDSSYAARSGAPRDVGVIGAAIFTERHAPPPPPVLELPAPRADRSSSSDGRFAPSDESAASPQASKGASRSAEPSAAPAAGAMAERHRGGLGTEFGEAVSSPIREVAFVRASPVRPNAILGVRYNDRSGLLAAGIDVDRLMCEPYGCDPEVAIRRTARPFPVVQRRYAAPPAGWGDR
jgi:hypothetical protein